MDYFKHKITLYTAYVKRKVKTCVNNFVIPKFIFNFAYELNGLGQRNVLAPDVL